MERGVIGSSGIIKAINQGFTVERNISKEELRYYLLYWDKVVIPANNLIYMEVPDEKELLSTGIISRPKVTFIGTFSGNLFTKAVLESPFLIAKEQLRDKTVDWVIHQIGESLSFPQDLLSSQKTIRVLLANALPVPDGETSIEHILKFKESRKDELAEFHNLMDEMYFEILNSPDQALSTKKIVSRLQTCIHDLEKVSGEKRAGFGKLDRGISGNLA